MMLYELIRELEHRDQDKIVPLGFSHPHSYRGDYSQLAFVPTKNVTIGSMLACAKEADGYIYTGWKGGEFQMLGITECWLANVGEGDGDMLGPRLLRCMFGECSGQET